MVHKTALKGVGLFIFGWILAPLAYWCLLGVWGFVLTEPDLLALFSWCSSWVISMLAASLMLMAGSKRISAAYGPKYRMLAFFQPSVACVFFFGFGLDPVVENPPHITAIAVIYASTGYWPMLISLGQKARANFG